MVVTSILFILFVTLTIVFLTGHGSFLVAGYNTLSDEEKRKYDKKKITRLVGILFLLIDPAFLAMLVMAYLEKWKNFVVKDTYAWIIVAYISLVLVIYLITVYRKEKRNQRSQDPLS